MESPSTLYPKKIDLTNCDKEPIHLVGKIQDFGLLLAFDPKTKSISHYSENCLEFFKQTTETIEKILIQDLIPQQSLDQVTQSLKAEIKEPIKVILYNQDCLLIPHVSQNNIVLEIEPDKNPIDSFEYQRQLTRVITSLSNVDDPLVMCQEAAELIKDIFEYDRVMVYKFDADWNGEVVAEQREPHLESWLGLHYPASDIPQQARKLFLKQGVRIIEDVSSTPVPIFANGKNDSTILDLSRSELRSVSPIHIEYLTNMKVGATLTAAIVFQNNLWGLIACHHYSPKHINYHLRLSCNFITQVFSTQLGLRSTNQLLEKTNNSNKIRSTLIEQMSKDWNIIEGLTKGVYTALDITEATGVAICIDNQIETLGNTPDKETITEILNVCLTNQQSGIYKTNNLSNDFDQFDTIRHLASGILCVFISPNQHNALLWFKPEVLQTVSWGGNPNKAVIKDKNERLSPRKSFEKWSEEKKGHSLPWQDYEVAAAVALKDHIAEIIVQKYDEIKTLNNQLKKAYEELETFSYSVSHDLRSPLRGIDGFAQIIKEDYFDSLDAFGKQAVDTIIASTHKMNTLIDDILSFSGLGKKGAQLSKLDMNILTSEVLDFLQASSIYESTSIKVNDLPVVYGDRTMMFQLMNNLIGNALKYSAKVLGPKVEIGYQSKTFYIKDNGIGFDPKHKTRIFGIFSRLVNDEYEGSGIGLAIAKRVVEKHQGKIWVESRPQEGTTFYFTLNNTKHE